MGAVAQEIQGKRAWEEQGIHCCTDRQIEEGGDLFIDGQVIHLGLEVAHARVDSGTSFAPRTTRLATEQRACHDHDKEPRPSHTGVPWV